MSAWQIDGEKEYYYYNVVIKLYARRRVRDIVTVKVERNTYV